MKKITPLTRMRRLLEVKQRDVKSSQAHLYKKRQDLAQQLDRLTVYRDEYVKMLMAKKLSPQQMDDTRRFLQQLEVSIEDTRSELDSQTQSENELQVVAGTLDSQQKSVERRISSAADAARSVDDAIGSGTPKPLPYSRDGKAR